MTDTTERKLFAPVQIGPMTLKHRVVMAPLTSQQPGDIPGALMREHYTQRALDGGLIVSEATAVSVTARGWLGAPGLYSDPEVEGLSKITQAVHAKGGRMFSQLWAHGSLIAHRDDGRRRRYRRRSTRRIGRTHRLCPLPVAGSDVLHGRIEARACSASHRGPLMKEAKLRLAGTTGSLSTAVSWLRVSP